MRLLLPLLALIGACIVVDPTRYPLAFEFAQAAVVDPEKPLAYLMAPESRIDKVDLSSGGILATGTQGARPLLLYNSIVLAQAEPHEQSQSLKLVGLNAKDLSVGFETDVPLPSGVHPLIDDQLGRSFYASARLEGGEIVVQWRFVQRRVTGVATSEPARIVAGWTRMDSSTGHLTSSGSGEAPVREEEFPATVQELAHSGALAGRPCRVDDLIAAIQYGEESGATSVVLRRWSARTGEALPDVKLFGGDLTFRAVSADCRHLLASRARDGWLWSIYSMATGDRLAEMRKAAPAVQFFIRNKHLFYLAPATVVRTGGQLKIDQPRRLLTVDFKGGKELWSRPIRETTYLGPYPARPPNALAR
jgi:hypothetical protein